MEKQVNIYRYEAKYFINKRQATELRLFLRGNMQMDSHTDDTGSYWIRSLYFDTINNTDYYDKVIGHNIRKKIRLRIYDTSTDSVKLEIKNKNGSCINKETVSISREDANKLIHGESHPLINYNAKAANKVFAFMHQNLYRPKVILDYEREAYLYPFQDIRITLDKNLRANNSATDLFQKDICMLPVFRYEVFILEIKYNHMLPVFLQRVLSSFAVQKSQISKYCLGRNIIGN